MILEALAELARKNKSEANLFFDKYQNQRQKFFHNRIAELNLLYNFSKDEEHALWGELLAAEQPQANRQSSVIKILHGLAKIELEKELVEDNEINTVFIGWLKTYWSQAWRKYANVNKCLLSARFTINKQKTRDDMTANMPNVEEELVDELRKVFPNAESIVKFDAHQVFT